MHMKYFQPIADIQRHYEDLFSNIKNDNLLPKYLLEDLGINQNELPQLKEEYEVLRYLIGCQLSIVREKNAQKPSLDVVNRLFQRHLFYLEKVHNCETHNVNKHDNSSIRKQYKACRHYLFQFSLPAWVEKLPVEILTFENKYPN